MLKQAIHFTDAHTPAITCEGPDLNFHQRVKTVPVLSIIGDSLYCEKSYRKPYAVVPESTADAFTWTVTGNRAMYTSTTNDLNRQVDWITPGIDTIFVSENNGACSGTAFLQVKVAPNSVTNFDWEIKSGTRDVLFTNTTEAGIINTKTGTDTVHFSSFTWDFGRENDKLYTQSYASYLATPDSIVQAMFKYGYFNVTLQAFSKYGCIDKITKTIFVDIKEGLYVPNSFEPESKSAFINKFQPKGFNLETYKIWIYDSWGNLLWYSDKLFNGAPAEGWDGTYNGTVLKIDTYIWKVEATFQDGRTWDGQSSSTSSKKMKLGNILLLR
jgi:hypothetical protein